MRHFAIDTESEMFPINGVVHGLEMDLVAAILLAHHADELPVVELGIARGTSLANRLLEAETLWGLAQDTGETLVGLHLCALLQQAG